MSTCKGCSTEVAEGAGKSVAHWIFCAPCFERMMNPPPPPPPAPAPAKRAERECLGCQKGLASGEGEQVAGTWWCTECHTVLVAGFTMPPQQPELPAPPEPPSAPQVDIDFNATVDCAGCGRQIVKVAGRERDGKLHCPDCFFKPTA